MLPTFLIIGVSRAGTTSLNRYLSAHAEVFMARNKELDFFSKHYDRGSEWYAQHFAEAGSKAHRGEATPSYFYTAEVPGRVASTLPSARLILSLRHPVLRLYSSYWMEAARGRADRPFGSVIAEELEAGSGYYLDQSKYADHLARQRAHFSVDQLHVLFFEDLAGDPREVFRSICNFLEIEEIVPPIVGDVINEYRIIRSLTVRRFSKVLPKVPQKLVGRLNSRSGRYPALEGKARDRLVEFFTPYNARLQALLDRPLPDDWSR